MGRIFLSHTEADVEAMEEIARGLEAAGCPCWYFERDVRPGTSYLLQITRAIAECDAVVLIASKEAVSSDQVTKEVVAAFERRIPFIPVLIDLTPPELKELQPEWRHALGGTAMLTVGTGGIPATIHHILEGLETLGLVPEGTQAPATAGTPVQRPGIEGERKQVTVLFADVADFTSMSEVRDPEEVHDLIAPCLDIMTEEIHRYGGTVVQFLGDGVMALFGAPTALEDAPQKAIHASLAIQRRISEYSKQLSSKGITFNTRIGLNSGLVIIGSVGDDKTMEYTATGDTVNMASHMKTACDPGCVQVAETTYHLAEGYFDFEELGQIQVKGKETTVKAYNVLSPRSVKTRVEASLPTGLSQFVGRAKELEHLSGCFEQAAQGNGQVVGIVGEPGVGKSRLILEFRRSLPEGSYAYLEGGCIHYGDTIAYLPLLQMLRSYFGIEEGQDEADARDKIKEKVSSLGIQLESVLSPLYELLSVEVEDQAYLNLEPQVKRQMVFDAIRGLLVTESQRGPLILALEDIQWIDKTSEEFLTKLIGSLAGTKIMLVLLYRSDYTPDWVSKSNYSQISLSELSNQTSTELIGSILSEAEVSLELCEFIVGRTSGNPLFIEEMTRGLIENGSIQRDNGQYVLSKKASKLQVPDTVQGIIASRIDNLEKNLKTCVQVASVIGREFAYRLLETVTPTREILRNQLSSLQELEFIYEKSLFPELEYIFRHALTQEVAYNSLLIKKRKELHGKIGQSIEQLYSDRLEEFCEMLAYHYSASDNTDKALAYLKLSGDKAARSYASWEAIRFYREAIRLLDAWPETEDGKKSKIEVHLSMLEPMAFLSFPEGSMESLREVERLAEELNDEESLMTVYHIFAIYHSQKGDTSLAMEYTLKCFAEAEKTGAFDLLAEGAFNICMALYTAGRFVELVLVARKVLESLEEQKKEKDLYAAGMSLYAGLSGWCAMGLNFLGEFEEANAAFERGIKFAREAGDTWGIGWLEVVESGVFGWIGDPHRLILHVEKAIECWEEIGVDLLLGTAWAEMGLGCRYLGDQEKARHCVEKAVEIHNRAGIPVNTPHVYWMAAEVLEGAGDLDEAKRYAEEGLRLSSEYEVKPYEGPILLVLGNVMGKTDRSQVEAAEQYMLKGLSIVEELGMKPDVAIGHLYLGELLAETDRKEEALVNLKKAEEMGLEMGMKYWLTRTQEALARLES
jgi:class 3 adenylate cyclase/tetratricopeptide (TPR) repeat protein